MEPWYKVATPRKEVREGRSFNPDEFAIHLEQVVAGTAPEDYKKPDQFFARTCFTRALKEHIGLVLRRLSGETANTPPVMTLITQFGGGKTHTLASLYHLVTNASQAKGFSGVAELLKDARLTEVPSARVAIFVGNAWDPQEGRETPWIDVARQLAGGKGVKELGESAKTTPPGTEALARVFAAADAPILILFDEVLNFMNRHRNLADPFHAFIQNLTVATTGTTHGATIISLPRSQVEMTEWDMQWQDRITKVVRRVAKDLIANDATEISEVVRRRLFEDIGSDIVRKEVAKTYAEWCFQRRAELPSEWTAVDTTTTEAKAKEFLSGRFEACYPFHPASLSVFQRKWQALPQYQQTRGTLAMLAQWVSCALKSGYQNARQEPLITLGSAPLEVPEFRSVVLGQLGESRLMSAIETDVSGQYSHAHALDADTKGPLKDIHRRVGTVILFESSGGQVDKVAHLPELRFALGEPKIDTTSVDSAAYALEEKSYFIRRVGSDGYRIGHQPTLKKVVNDRRASLDEESEINPAMRKLIEDEFRRGGGSIPLVFFPEDGAAIQDTPKLVIVAMDPSYEWTEEKDLRQRITEWTRMRGKSPRLYPGSLVWCFKKPGRDLHDKVELMLAWERVKRETDDGTLGGDFERSERQEIAVKLKDASEAAKDEVWGGFRYVVLSDNQEKSGLKTIDLGAGHSSASESLCGRIITALKSQALLNESVGAGYIERNWPTALKETGAWPMAGLRQSFLNGSLTRLLDPDITLRGKLVEFIQKGDFGFASGQKADGTYDRCWYREPIAPEEVVFESGVFLLLKSKAEALKGKPIITPTPPVIETPKPGTKPGAEPEPKPGVAARTIRITGDIPPEIWNRLGTKILPKLRSGSDLKVGVEFTVTIDGQTAQSFEAELRQIIEDLGLTDKIRIA